MKKISRDAILNSINLISRQLGGIQKISLKVTTQKKSVFFAANHSRIKSHNSSSKFASQFKRYSDINHITSITIKMPSKKRITRVRFNDSSRPANPPYTPTSSSGVANQPLNYPTATRTANPPPIITTTNSPALSSNISTLLTPSRQTPTFNNITNKIFSKSLIAALTSKASLKRSVIVF